VVLHQADHAEHAQRRGEPCAFRGVAGAVELAAADALDDLGFVAGDAAEVPLEADVAAGGALGVVREGVQLARPGGALGGGGGEAMLSDSFCSTNVLAPASRLR